MPKSATQIRGLYQELKTGRGALMATMHDICKHIDGSWALPLPEMDQIDKPAVANLMAQATDQLAMRVSSVSANISSLPVSTKTAISALRAQQRKMAVMGWHEMNRTQLLQRLRARYLIAYGLAPARISPMGDDDRRIPHVQALNPLHVFPAPTHSHTNYEPDYCISVETHSLFWLETRFPEATKVLHKGQRRDIPYTILRYEDANETTLVAVGSDEISTSDRHGYEKQPDGDAPEVILSSIPNRMGLCPIVVPTRMTIAGVSGQFNSMVGMYEQQARLDALTYIAIRDSVFPEQWLVSHPNAPAKPGIIRDANARDGTIGIVEYGQIETVHKEPGQLAFQYQSQLERAQRLTAGLPAEFGGESPSNVRTARRGEFVMGNVVDMPIQEYQEIFEASFEAEHRRMIAVQMKYYPEPTKFFFLPGEDTTPADYDPKEIFGESRHIRAKFPLPGVDSSAMTVAIGQKIGMRTMSNRTAMELDNTIDDVDLEISRIEEEGLLLAIEQALQAEAQAPGGASFVEISEILDLKRKENIPLDQAVLKAQKEKQAQQAAPPEPQEQGEPGAQDPDQMPGLHAAPGAPGQAPAAIPAPSASSQNLMQMLASLHTPAGASAQAG